MKICNKCKQNKALVDFNRNKCKIDGRNNFCKECSKISSKKYYFLNKEKHIQKTAERKARVILEYKAKIREIKIKNPCLFCGESEPCCLDFHHLRDKEHLVSKMVHECRKWKAIEKEISKCILLCSNCHRKIHANLLEYKEP